MVEHDGRLLAVRAKLAFELVNQRERRAGYLFGLGGVEALGDSLHQGGLAGTEISAKDEKFWRGEQLGDLAADGDGLFAAASLEYVAFASCRFSHILNPWHAETPVSKDTRLCP